jgi:DNA-binding transcriptional regulator YdaS (Cro superfamily)
MQLNIWIEKTGPKKVAKLLRVDPSSVSQWRTRGVLPRPRIMIKINKLSGGRVTYEEMIQSAAKKQRK